jgi:hypothetical protein
MMSKRLFLALFTLLDLLLVVVLDGFVSHESTSCELALGGAAESSSGGIRLYLGHRDGWRSEVRALRGQSGTRAEPILANAASVLAVGGVTAARPLLTNRRWHPYDSTVR